MGENAVSHFKGKDAIGHVAEAQARGIISSAEIHGTEIPGHIFAGTDAARETAIVVLMLGVLLTLYPNSSKQAFAFTAIFMVGWLIWKAGRSAWLGWSRLERLHRILEQERWEIEHNRAQEKEELTALYAAKGFEGKLLTDAIDVLMADGDRLLRVMVEEELGLSLHVQEHPLKQGLGAAMGCLIVAAICLPVLYLGPLWLFFGAAFGCVGISALLSAYYEGNHLIPAALWNLGLGALAFASAYFLLDFFFAT